MQFEIYCHKLIVKHKFCYLMQFAMHRLRMKYYKPTLCVYQSGREKKRESLFVCFIYILGIGMLLICYPYAMHFEMAIWLLKIIDQFLSIFIGSYGTCILPQSQQWSLYQQLPNIVGLMTSHTHILRSLSPQSSIYELFVVYVRICGARY